MARGVAGDTAVLDVLAGGKPQSYSLGDIESNLLNHGNAFLYAGHQMRVSGRMERVSSLALS